MSGLLEELARLGSQHSPLAAGRSPTTPQPSARNALAASLLSHPKLVSPPETRLA